MTSSKKTSATALASLHLLPSQSVAKAGEALTLDVLVALRAPARATQKQRPSLNLAVVIDNSGSMNGMPLWHAKQAAASLVHGLQAQDRVAIVVYSTHARVVLPSMTAEEAKLRVDGVLANVNAESSTALHAGWLTGAGEIAPFVSQYGVSRVLLLSDGQANQGEVRIQALSEAGQKLAQAGITTSTYGLGLGFNEVLMTAIAEAGQGLAVYAENADDLSTYFANEFAMLCDLAGKDIRIGVSAVDASGKTVIGKCLNALPTADDNRVRLPALLSGAESWAIYSFEVPKGQAKADMTLSAKATFVDEEGRTHTLESQSQVKFGRKAGGEDETVVERAKEVRAGAMAREAAEAAMRGDMDRSNHLIRGITGMAGNNAYVAAVALNLSQVSQTGNASAFAKEALYSSTTMSNRVVDSDENFRVLDGGKYGLRKAAQGKAQKGSEEKSA